ncbi:SpaH/EbpB family LPXTG-anchored major pilin [uncultured Mobiluncus sp.]|uniref:SpaH/EbpB family LPXTG-anchored major pilin n=1 Tax=uncultured Mobiluncus sp. TaxID=293425 RepID=UPI00260CD835|nr:SpaH/EbpB family LPXTG-anchored major pilin [uncultured Mobiluncus sp.]
MKSIGIPIWRRAVAIFATGAVALLGAAGMLNAPAASAAPIKPDTNGSITVHALTMPTGGSTVDPTGKVQTPPTGAKAIKDATFKLEKSSINITTNAGYEQALTLTAQNFGAKDTSFGAPTGTTGEDGSHTFSGLKPGVYLLTQVSAPAGKILMNPAIVFVPMTDPEHTDTWVYDIHVYPKNGDAGKIVKTDITPKGTPIAAGSTMTWQMDVPIPDIGTSDSYTKFVVQDLPTNMKAMGVTSAVLDPTGSKVALSGGGSDYDVALDTPATNQLQVTFTANGLNKLNDTTNPAKGKTLRLVVTTKVLNTVTPESGVTNAAKAIYTTANGGADSTTEIESDPNNPANTTFGNLKILNKNAEGTQTLSGGKFKIYKCAGSPLGTETTGDPIAVTPTGSSTATSEFEITDAANGITLGPLGTTTQDLCLVQTKAPDGYQQLAGPQTFVFDATTVNAASGKTVTVTVTNTSTSSITGLLPNTGGMGIALFVVLGLVLLGGAAVYMHRQRS